jgi:hypothetical protein
MLAMLYPLYQTNGFWALHITFWRAITALLLTITTASLLP